MRRPSRVQRRLRRESALRERLVAGQDAPGVRELRLIAHQIGLCLRQLRAGGPVVEAEQYLSGLYEIALGEADLDDQPVDA